MRRSLLLRRGWPYFLNLRRLTSFRRKGCAEGRRLLEDCESLAKDKRLETMTARVLLGSDGMPGADADGAGGWDPAPGRDGRASEDADG